MKKLLTLLAAVLLPLGLLAQEGGVEVDYNRPQKYILGGVSVEGNHYFSSTQIVNLTGLQEGMEVTIPSEEMSGVVKRLSLQRFFDDVSLDVDHLSPARDSIYLKIHIVERPRVSRWTFSGVKSGEKKDLQDRLSLRRGGEFSAYVEKTASDIIKRFYAEKGFLNCEVKTEVQEDSVIRNAIRVNFAVDRGDKVKVREINFYGNEHVKEYKLAKSMKKTKSNKWYNFFHSKKFDAKEYPNDKKTLLSAFNEAGYRDARIVKDTMYYLEPGRLAIDITVEEGDRYYFRDISWTGNSVYTTDALNEILGVKKGDVYDVVSMEKRLFGGGKQNEYDVSKLYRDNGYLFFQVNPVETNIQNDSVDVEMRISEGKQATLNNIVINGNDLTSEKIVRRQIFTRPGYLFSQTDFERSIREIASLGQFDQEAIADPTTGYSIVPNQINNTVDIIYNVTEKPSSQLELSGGWGGHTFVATAGVAFNNFSTHRMFEKGAWRPVPLGDAQNLSFHFQTNGSYYTAISAGFTEPWLTGKKPTSLNLSAYYTRQTASNSSGYYNYFYNYTVDRILEIYGFSASIGTRLKWPDNYFVLYNSLNWQSYNLQDWNYYFIYSTGRSHNISWSTTLSRNSTDQSIYPRTGADLTLGLQITPPWSLLKKDWRNIDYSSQSVQDHYRWIEYHKWTFKGSLYSRLVGDLVLMTRAQFGFLGYFNKKWGYSPFEGFIVGGDGMSGYNTYGNEVIGLRGYENYSLTPYIGNAYAGNVYDKFTVELRYPIIMQPSSTIFALLFLEGGNSWSDIKDFNPFQIKRSAGVGLRVFLPVVGLLGIDWGYGFDAASGKDKSHFHFLIGQQF